MKRRVFMGDNPSVTFDPQVYNPAIDEMLQQFTSDINIYANTGRRCDRCHDVTLVTEENQRRAECAPL
jgi:formamidopyrimidine-DNA glycosylase